MDSTLYALLGVRPDAEPAVIAQAYAERLESAGRDPTVDRAALTYAYLVLSDAERRAAYDAALRLRAEGAREGEG